MCYINMVLHKKIMLTSICLFMLKQRPAEIRDNLRKRKVKKMRCFFLKPSQGSIPLYIKKQKAPCWVHLFFGADEGKT